MAKEGTKVISVRLDAGNYEKLQKMAVINKSTISAVASEVINSSFDDIERVDKRVEHLEELVFSVLDHLTLMQAFNKEVYTTLLVRKARSLSLTDRSTFLQLGLNIKLRASSISPQSLIFSSPSTDTFATGNKANFVLYRGRELFSLFGDMNYFFCCTTQL